MAEGDLLHRFLFEDLPVRGQFVRLDASWRAAIEHHEYPRPVSDVLGEALAACALMAGSLKFEGRLSLQIEGPGPVRLLLAQCTHQHAIRGVVRHRPLTTTDPDIAGLFGGGRLAITIEQETSGEQYQGLVGIELPRLAGCLERYFERSEQLPSHLLLAAGPERAAGILLQRVAAGPGEDWQRIGLLLATLSPAELLELPCHEILRRLYSTDDIRLFGGTPVFYRCNCSRERVSGILQALGADELRALLCEEGGVEVRCEFCRRCWHFDAVDVAGLLADGAGPQAPPSLH